MSGISFESQGNKMLIIYLIIGALSGTLAGMLGVGGGVIVVPALAAVFHYIHMPQDTIMRMAIGTSLATIIVTLLSALRAQIKHSAVRWDWVKKLTPWLLFGVIIGAAIANTLSSFVLQIVFSVFLIYVAYRLLFTNLEDKSKPQPSLIMVRTVGATIGVLSSILGAGGGTMIIPFLLRCQVNLREATGTSVACSIGIAFVATISFMLLGFATVQLKWSTGYIYWPAFLGIAAASILFAPVGTAIAYRLPTSILKRILGVFLIIVAINMLIPI
jgi:uncharacterized protein